jgi:hypothetical protein
MGSGRGCVQRAAGGSFKMRLHVKAPLYEPRSLCWWRIFISTCSQKGGVCGITQMDYTRPAFTIREHSGHCTSHSAPRTSHSGRRMPHSAPRSHTPDAARHTPRPAATLRAPHVTFRAHPTPRVPMRCGIRAGLRAARRSAHQGIRASDAPPPRRSGREPATPLPVGCRRA